MTIAVKRPKPLRAVMGDTTFAAKDTQVVIDVTNIALPALRMVHEILLAKGQAGGRILKDCFQASMYTKISSDPIPIIRNTEIKFKKGKNVRQRTTWYRV